MADYSDMSLTALSNPLTIQGFILDEFKERISGGNPIVDPNSVFYFVLEAFSSITGQAVNEICNLFPALYPNRALTVEDLYRHMSDYDYLGLFSTPASCEITLDFDKTYLTSQAKDFNNNYKKVIIPKNSTFYIGKYSFGIHYPIEIKINKLTDTYVVTYDTSTSNPLQVLSSNAIEHREYQYAGVNFISIKLPIFQFIKTDYVDDLIENTGFSKVYEYTNKFYATRIYHLIDSNWVEIAQTLSDQTYNPRVVTAKILVETDLSVIKVTIPQTYFTNSMIGSKIKIELYTTRGALDADISEITVDNISAKFTLSSVVSENLYSTILNKLPTIIMSPISTKIVGGGNGYTFEELSSRVINDTFYGKVLITPDDLEKKFFDLGFTALKYKDNLTERIYFCYKELTDNAGVIIPTAALPVQLTDALIADTDSIKTYSDGSITILPTTLFKYVDQMSLPVDDTELSRINGLGVVAKLDEYNNNTYTNSPFHIRLDTTSQTPLAYCYDLTAPTIDNIEFISENINISSQLNVYNASLTHLDNGSGGYDLNLLVSRTDDLVDVPPEDVIVYVSTVDIFNKTIWLVGEYQGEVSGRMNYKLHIATNYNISNNHALTVSGFTSQAGSGDYTIPLETEFELLLLVAPEHLPGTSAALTSIASGIASEYLTYIPTTKQLLKVNLGHLVPEVFNSVDIMYSGLEYAVWESTEYATYSSDVYEQDEFGVITYTINVDEVVLNKLHSIGDQILDAEGDPIPLHVEGDVILNSNGVPVVDTNRSIIYVINMIQVDAKLSISEDKNHEAYMTQLKTQLRTYFDAVGSVSGELIENTQLYFKPLRSIGFSEFKRGDDSTLELSLELTMALNVYVEDYVKNDTAMTTLIRSTILSIIDEHISTGTVSMTAISADIKSSMPEDIKHVDILGINGDTTLQTLITTSEDVLPNLKQELVVVENGSIGVSRGLTLEFIKMN